MYRSKTLLLPGFVSKSADVQKAGLELEYSLSSKYKISGVFVEKSKSLLFMKIILFFLMELIGQEMGLCEIEIRCYIIRISVTQRSIHCKSSVVKTHSRIVRLFGCTEKKTDSFVGLVVASATADQEFLGSIPRSNKVILGFYVRHFQ